MILFFKAASYLLKVVFLSSLILEQFFGDHLNQRLENVFYKGEDGKCFRIYRPHMAPTQFRHSRTKVTTNDT